MDAIARILSSFAAQFNGASNALQKQINQTMMLAAQQNSISNGLLQNIDSLADVEFKVLSQWGEDGILDWLVTKLPPMPEIFIEFGVENYMEANTRYLLCARNWRGLVMDGSAQHINSIKKDSTYWMHDLTAAHHFITRENIDSIISGRGFSGDIGILSIDIDGNDYWVWEAIHCVNPVIVVCEYSAILGDMHPISTPYAADFTRLAAHHSGQYAGASLPALIHLAERRGYSLAGTTSTGLNAFFIRNDYFTYISGAIRNISMHASRFSDTRDAYGNFTYVRGAKRLELIKHLPVVNVVTEAVSALQDIVPLYSEDFLRQMRGGV